MGLAIGGLLDPNPAMGEKRYQALDGMRGLCALFVATFHFDMLLNSGHLLNHGWLSVDIFFVLSGFVIAMVYEDRLKAGMGTGSFLAARARRLIPTHVAGTLIVGLTYFVLFWAGRLTPAAVTQPILFVALVWGLFQIPITWSPFARLFTSWDTTYPINSPLWSLNGEWVINIIYGRWLYAARSATLLCLFVLFSAYLLYMAFLAVGWPDLLKILPDIARACTGFIAGVVICRINSADDLKRLPKMGPMIIYAAWFFICAVPLRQMLPVYEMSVTLIGAPLMIALLVRNERPVPRIFSFLGRLSYPLYVSHWAIKNMFFLWLPPATRHSAFLLVPMLLLALVLAWLLERAVLRITEAGYIVNRIDLASRQVKDPGGV
jgi:peptidoglycan/LPS O-acetylase OafA/YrhL